VLTRELHLAELVTDHQLLDLWQGRRIDDRLDVVAITFVGRDAARARVRMHEQARALQLGEHVAHGGARHAEPVTVDQCLRPDRGRRRHVFLDDGPEDPLLANVQRAACASDASRQGLGPRG
jgi:hypothetical protein